MIANGVTPGRCFSCWYVPVIHAGNGRSPPASTPIQVGAVTSTSSVSAWWRAPSAIGSVRTIALPTRTRIASAWTNDAWASVTSMRTRRLGAATVWPGPALAPPATSVTRTSSHGPVVATARRW